MHMVEPNLTNKDRYSISFNWDVNGGKERQNIKNPEFRVRSRRKRRSYLLNSCMEIAVNPEVLWNIILTIVVILPLGFLVRSILGEQKRLDILINKTREEIAKDYVTRESMEATFERLMDSIDKIDEKIDRLQQRTYFQE